MKLIWFFKSSRLQPNQTVSVVLEIKVDAVRVLYYPRVENAQQRNLLAGLLQAPRHLIGDMCAAADANKLVGPGWSYRAECFQIIRRHPVNSFLAVFIAVQIFRTLSLQAEDRLIGTQITSQRPVAKSVYFRIGDAEQWNTVATLLYLD